LRFRDIPLCRLANIYAEAQGSRRRSRA
jgi:hypothetical protein